MPVKIIGITGNSGSGKSYVSEFIKKYYLEQNIKTEIIDADQVAKSMQNSESEYMRAIVREFGEDIIEFINNMLEEYNKYEIPKKEDARINIALNPANMN